MWGLGATIHETLTGAQPFARVAGERFPQIHAVPRPLPREVPPELVAAVLACLEPRPEDRPTAGGLADVLEPLAGALPAPRLGRFRPGGRALMGRLERS